MNDYDYRRSMEAAAMQAIKTLKSLPKKALKVATSTTRPCETSKTSMSVVEA